MIEIMLKAGILLTGIMIIQTTYNTVLYRQPRNFGKIATVANVTIITAVVAAGLWWLVNYLDKIPYLSRLIIAIDSPFKAFWNYLPKLFLLIWFIVPVALIWIVFLFKGGIIYRKIKKEYFKFVNSGSKKEIVEPVEPIKPLSPVEPQGKIIPKKEQDHVLHFESKAPPKKYFLEDVKTKAFEHRTVRGIAKVLPLAKSELIIGKTLQGYVAIYETSQGYKQLKQIFSKNSIDITNLQAKPSIVLFTQNNVRCFELKDYIKRIRAGEKIYES